MQVVKIEVEEMPHYVGQSLAQLGAAYSGSAVKKRL